MFLYYFHKTLKHSRRDKGLGLRSFGVVFRNWGRTIMEGVEEAGAKFRLPIALNNQYTPTGLPLHS